MPNEITEVTRRRIFDILINPTYYWTGCLTEDRFLSRLFDLSTLPSTDSRYKDARRDIMTHTISFPGDWPDDWILYDDRFNLLRCDDTCFLKFVCETVHPIVRTDLDIVNSMVTNFNSLLKTDGWKLRVVSDISGLPIFQAFKSDNTTQIFTEPTGWIKVDRQLQEVISKLRSATTEEQYQSVGHMSREVLISLAEAVYNSSKHGTLDGVSPSNTDAKRKLEAFIESELVGSANEEIRTYMKAALKLANTLQHHRTANYKIAALCAEATKSVVNIISILTDRK
ncbi:hypothetical protein [Dehalococcoides mccartyi]|uniref:AbiJ-related protein n=1 Tax=Dehalococcoides mccartyi TaxID=61435 RepID=UPI0006BDCC03|nr:hypothetical protein [Dehalococcoides mccartyi]QYY57809.1 hypothetical protein CWV2_001069 [Dehalococcoides mccartyi]BAS32100.1 hypothetical protein IBK_1057 [Dehalococcoides mccartyi IBARAKI]BEL01159.1 hypothetical protein DMOBY_10120 [Dehalococcoides mccartyi]